MPHGLERVRVYVGHVVVDSMPRRTEATLAAVGIIGDDVDAWYAGNGVHRTMVVGDCAAVLLREDGAVAQFIGTGFKL